MQPLDRLFGKEISKNLANYHHVKHEANKSRPYGRSTSFAARNYSKQTIQVNDQKDKKNEKSQALPLAAKKIRKDSQPLNEVLTDYCDQSLDFMLKQQLRESITQKKLSNQQQITDNMRTILIDWVVEIHQKYKMFPQTFFIVISIIDSYLNIKSVRKDELYLIGSAAIFMGAKYEQTYQVPQAHDLINLSGKSFTKRQLIRMESQIIKALDFNLIFNTPYHFFEPFAKMAGIESKNFFLSQYLLELSLTNLKFSKYRPSLLASASIFLINRIKRVSEAWPDVLMAASGYEESQLRGCAKELCFLLESAEQIEYGKNIKKKFARTKFEEVSKMRIQKRDKGKN